jgi:hypothetical protein
VNKFATTKMLCLETVKTARKYYGRLTVTGDRITIILKMPLKWSAHNEWPGTTPLTAKVVAGKACRVTLTPPAQSPYFRQKKSEKPFLYASAGDIKTSLTV